MNAKYVVLETENISFIFQDCQTDIVVITFNEMGMTASGDRFWGDNFFLQKNISSVGVVSKRPNWYPEDDMKLGVEAVNKIINGKRVITYGHSQGGYGALKYSSAFNAEAALSFSPQWSINPSDVEDIDQRYIGNFSETLKGGKRIEKGDICKSCFVFFDPLHEVDKKNAYKIIALSEKINFVPTPFFGHEAIRAFSEGKVSSSVFDFIKNGKSINREFLRNSIRNARLKSPSYITFSANALMERPGNFKIFLEKAADRLPQDRQILFNMRMLVAHQRFSEAEEFLNSVPDSYFSSMAMSDLFGLRQFFRDNRFISGEIRAAKHMDVPENDDPFIRLHSINTYVHAGLTTDAIQSLERIVGISKLYTNTGLMGFIQGYSISLRRIDIFERVTDRFLESAESDHARIELKLSTAEIFHREGIRDQAFRYAKDVVFANTKDISHMRRLSKILFEMGETALALDIRQSIVRINPEDSLAKIEAVDIRATINRDAAYQELKILMKSSEQNPAFWESCSSVAERLIDYKLAIKAMENFMSCGGSTLRGKVRIAYIYVIMNSARKAKNEIKSIIAIKGIDHFTLRFISDLAKRAGDRQLALIFSERQYNLDPNDPSGVVHLSICLIECNMIGKAESLLRELLEKAKKGMHLPSELWITVAENLQRLRRPDLEQEAIKEGSLQHPEDTRLSGRLNNIRRMEALGFGAIQGSSETIHGKKNFFRRIFGV